MKAPHASLKRQLQGLALAVLLPAILLGLVSTGYVYLEERSRYRSSVQDRVDAVALVVDKEIARRAEVLRAMAASPHLDAPDLAAFHAHAKRLAPHWHSTIVLLDPSGQQLLNTRRDYPPPQPLPRRNDNANALRARFGPEAVVVSNLYLAPIGKALSFAVEVPVTRNGQLRYYLAMGSFATQMQALLQEQTVPSSWTAALLDHEGTIVARNIAPEKHVGQKARPDLLAALQRSHRGWFETLTRDGRSVTAFYSRAPQAGWSLAVGVPTEQITASAWNAAAIAGLGTAVIAALALALASAFGGRIVRAVDALVRDAQRLGRGEAVTPRLSGLRELDTVNLAMVGASEALRGAHAEMERRVEQAIRDTEEAERRLLQAQKLDALGRLTAGVAHDFNNLLQTIYTGLRVVEHGSVDARSKAALQSCRRALDKATRVTRHLASFAGGQASNPETLDIADKLSSLGELLRGAIGSQVQLQIDVAGPLPAVHLDPLEFELALLNLAINARDAMPHGGLLTISTAPAEHDGAPGVRLRVADTGTGMPPEVLRQATEPFFTTKAAGKGSGLGLAQVHSFAARAGGRLQIDSTLGQGTEVAIWLPALRAPTKDSDRAEPAPPAAGQRALSVMLVDDEETIRDVTAAALRAQGFDVRLAADAQQALQALTLAPADLLFTDIVMPGARSGIELAREVRRQGLASGVLLATGFSDQRPAAGEFELVSKPYDVEDVARRLRRLASQPARPPLLKDPA